MVVALCGWRVFAAFLVAGFLLGHAAAASVLAAAYDCGERRLVEARVDSIPVPQGAGWQFDAWVEPISEPRHAPLRVRISHPGAGATIVYLNRTDSGTGGLQNLAQTREKAIINPLFIEGDADCSGKTLPRIVDIQ